MFQVGQLYTRQKIHALYGGQEQGGISTPKNWPWLFLFAGEQSERYGCPDGWDEHGVFRFLGEGTRGDMEFTRGNRALRDHAGDGKDVVLFESLGRSKPVRYLGLFACVSWENIMAPDDEGALRRALVFHLVSAADSPEFSATAGEEPEQDLETLRRRAVHASDGAGSGAPAEAARSYYRRCRDVRRYVTGRAAGRCENCGSAAPFLREDGSPYLEVHYLRRLSDNGPDHPRYVAALCPACHREIRHGARGEAIRSRLLESLAERESEAAADGARNDEAPNDDGRP